MNREEEAKAILNAAAKAILDAAGVLPSERYEEMWDLARRDAAAAFAVFEEACAVGSFVPAVSDAQETAHAPSTDEREALAIARNIVNQIGDVYHERIPSPDWVQVRQETNDELDAFTARLIAGFRRTVQPERPSFDAFGEPRNRAAQELQARGDSSDDERAEAERVQKAAWAEIHGQDPRRRYSVAEVKRIVYSFDNVLSGLLSRRTVQGESFDEGTLVKVYDALITAFPEKAEWEIRDAVNALQNAGILFRERTVQGEPAGADTGCPHDAWEIDTEGNPTRCADCGDDLAAVPGPQGEPSDAAVAAGLDAWFRTSRQSLRESMRAALRAAAEAEGGNR